MTKLTIVYTDGHQEHYNITETHDSINAMNGLKKYKEVIEDGVLKLVIEGQQIVLIPMTNIRKIISQRSDFEKLKAEDYPGFLNAKLID